MPLKPIALAAAVALLGVPLLAQQMPSEPPGRPDPARVAAGTYALDPHHALIGWRVNHLGFSDYFGLLGESTGTLALDPANPGAAKLDVTVPVGKILTANPALTAHLLRPGKDGGKPDFFGADPADARFVSTRVTPGSDGMSATIVGDLTLNGETHPVTIAATFTGAGTFPGMKPTVGFSGKATIQRSQWGVSAGVPLVSDTVELEIAAPFEKQ